jgi:prepilin-type N-terminal cleavage/methylation domain-containing protein
MRTETNNKGFTLIELLVVITIIGILLAIGTHNFSAWSRKSNMEAQVKQIYTDLLATKIDSMHRKTQLDLNVYVVTNGYDTRDSLGNVVLPLKTVHFPVTTSAGPATNLTVTFDVNGMKTSPATTQAICLQEYDPGLAYDSIIIDQVKVNLAKRNSSGGGCAVANCVIK